MRWWWPAPCVSRATAKPAAWRNIRAGLPCRYLKSKAAFSVCSLRTATGKLCRRRHALNRDALRNSSDIDVFDDREERVAAAALSDVETLVEAGYRVSWLRQLPLIYTAEIAEGNAATRLEWVWTAPSVFSRPYGMRTSATSSIRLTWPPTRS